MRDTRSLLLTIVSILLIVVSMALLWSWGYNYGNKKQSKEKGQPIVMVSDKDAIKPEEAAAMRRMYADAKKNYDILDSTLIAADSLKLDIGDKLKEFYTLRDQLSNLLGDPSSKSNLINAIAKISELQNRVERLRKQNQSIEKENKRLAALLAQLSKIQTPVYDLTLDDPNTPNVPKVDSDQTKIDPVIPAAPTEKYTIDKIGFEALANNEDDPNETTSMVKAVSKFKGSFELQNHNLPSTYGEFIVVVTQPSGRVLKSSTWESGTFETSNGRKIYTCKVKYECNKGESRTFNFKIEPEELHTGTYQMQLYFNKELIGTATKTLQ
jgi:hypothetical protein